MKEVTYEEWQKNPIPRMMWVWDGNERDKVTRKVIYFNENKHAHYPIIALSENGVIPSNYMHCAEIGKQRRMTNQELAWWLQDGIKDGKHRECKYGKKSDNSVVTCNFNYLDRAGYDEVCENTLIREDDGEWHEPLVEDHYKD